MSHNGYKNYETWAVCLWLDNDQYSQERWAERARELQGADEENGTEDWKSHLAADLQNDFENNAPDLGNGVYGDLLTAAASEVDWYEVAETRANE